MFDKPVVLNPFLNTAYVWYGLIILHIPCKAFQLQCHIVVNSSVECDFFDFHLTFLYLFILNKLFLFFSEVHWQYTLGLRFQGRKTAHLTFGRLNKSWNALCWTPMDKLLYS